MATLCSIKIGTQAAISLHTKYVGMINIKHQKKTSNIEVNILSMYDVHNDILSTIFNCLFIASARKTLNGCQIVVTCWLVVLAALLQTR